MLVKQRTARLWAFLPALSLLLSLAACGGQDMTAATMHLKRAEGRVAVSDGDGKDVPLLDNLGLYSGYGVDTRSESYAWIDLDDVKLAKLDQKSEIAIQKEGKDLEIKVKSGSLFFNVTRPLEDDETMTISTSTMMVGIRGTCGWMEERDGLSRVYLLEGNVRCSADGQAARIYAGEMAELTEDGEITVVEFTARDIPAFVMEEVEEDDGLAQAILEDSGLDVLNPDEPVDEPVNDPVADALEQYRIIVSQADSYVYDEYSSDDAEISYQYALVQLRPEDAVPTLLLEQVSESYFGYFGYARVFQYDPESGIVHQPDDILMEGVAGAGGYRGGLSMMGDGNGIQSLDWYSGTGEATAYRVTLEGDALLQTLAWEGIITDAPDAIAINWRDISDAGGLDSWTPGADVPAPQPEPEQPPEPEPLPVDGDRIVFTGTINRYTYDELLDLQGMSDPNPGPYNVERGWIFQLIVLDTPQTMNLTSGSGDGLREGIVSIVSVTGAEGMEQYDGQHLIFSIDPSRTWWPSDVSAPFGEPRTSDIHVLGTAPSN